MNIPANSITMLRSILFLSLALTLAGCHSEVEVISRPAGARITVDGEYIGNAPCKFRVLESGTGIVYSSYEVQAKLDGYQDKTEQIPFYSAKQDQVTFNFSLEPEKKESK